MTSPRHRLHGNTIVKYIPPFETVKGFFQILAHKKGLQVSSSYDEFITFVKLMLTAVYVDEDWYLREYPDVDDAVRSGQFSSAKSHFVENGYFEGRYPCEPVIDEVWYLNRYPDVAESVKRGEFASGLRHFVEDGHREGRLPFGY